jgi:hypothetical protein
MLSLGDAARRLEGSCRDDRPFAADLVRMRTAVQQAAGVLNPWTERLVGLPAGPLQPQAKP